MKKALIIVVGPSGAGKSSFVDKIVGEVDFLEDTITIHHS
ncbi:MAG: ATP-binding cassette domain-containing protein [Bdellovibrionales bacterium]